jgi:prevent-host-death family protein
MIRTSANEFRQKLDEFQSHARREPVEITRRGRRELVLLSATQYDWLTAAARRTHLTREATDIVLDAVEDASMDPRHDVLDDLLR